MIVDSSGEDDEVFQVEDSEPEPEKWPDAEKLPDDVFLKMKAGDRFDLNMVCYGGAPADRI